MVTSFLFFLEKDFYALPRDCGLSEEEVFFKTPDGILLHGWFFEAPGAEATLVFFHGNAGNISGRLFKAKGWVERGISVFLMDYRGYGKSEGRIEKGADLIQDARSAVDWVNQTKKIPFEKIILYGESIGSYPALALACERKFEGLVLEAPFTTLLELARTHYGWVPEMLLKDFPMKNQDSIPSIKAPVFILHGDQDEVSPVKLGEQLYESAPSPKEFYVIRGGHHNDLLEVAGAAYFDYAYQFLARENGFRQK